MALSGAGAAAPAAKTRAMCEAETVGLSYGRQRLCGARAAESSSVRAQSCRALAGVGGGYGCGCG